MAVIDSFRQEQQVSPLDSFRRLWMVIYATAVACGKNKISQSGPLFYILVWLSFPVFGLLTAALIYKNDVELRDYAIVAGSAVSFIFLMLYGASSVLDNERQRGTLGSLFLAPTPRFAWLGGFQLFNLVEVLVSASASLTIGAVIFGIDLSINPWSLLVTLALFFSALWGLSMVIGSIGVLIRDANQLVNLLFNIVLLFAGTMFPMDRAPEWVQVPARCMPFSYGMESLVGSITGGKSIADMQSSLLPLAGFAIVLPVIGYAVFSRLEKISRTNGALEFMA
jgi:ABC-2 type transport system permease protein